MTAAAGISPKPASLEPANLDLRALAFGGLGCRRPIKVACSATTNPEIRPDPGHRGFMDDVTLPSNR